MTSRSLIWLFAACAVAVGISSCKKTERQPTISSKIAGKWNKVRYATDDNGNNQLDSWEQHEVAAGNDNQLEFKNDNTGIEHDAHTQDLSFTWMLNGEQSLMMIYSTGDTVVSKITLLNSANLNLTSRGKFGLVGYYYDRQ